MKPVIFLFILYAFLILPGISLSASPSDILNKEISREIRTDLGISLKSLSEAITGNNIKSRDFLIAFSLNSNATDLLNDLNRHSESEYQNCFAQKMNNCTNLKRQSQKETQFFNEMYSRSRKGGDAALYWATILIAHRVRYQILPPYLKRWSETCTEQTINTVNCKRMIKNINMFNEIILNISHLAYQKMTGKPLDAQTIKKINNDMRAYE